jgi:hypothetical protein
MSGMLFIDHRVREITGRSRAAVGSRTSSPYWRAEAPARVRTSPSKGIEFTIKELAELVIDMMGSTSKLSNEPLPQGDPKQRQSDIALAKRELGWSAKIALRQVLKKTIDYCDQLLSECLPKKAEAAE